MHETLQNAKHNLKIIFHVTIKEYTCSIHDCTIIHGYATQSLSTNTLTAESLSTEMLCAESLSDESLSTEGSPGACFMPRGRGGGKT